MNKGHGFVPYEEISEKKTTKLGYVLLTLMSIFIIQAGQAVFRDLEKIPNRPTMLSFCSYQMKTLLDLKSPQYLGRSGEIFLKSDDSLNEQNCAWSTYEDRTGIKQLIVSAYPKLARYFELKTQLQTTDQEINEIGVKRDRTTKNYTLSLEEQQAKIPGIIDRDLTSQKLNIENKTLAALEAKKLTLLDESEQLISELKQQGENYNALYTEANHLYEKDNAWYRFKIFFLMSLFILPFFILSLRKYFLYKKTNSPCAIITSALVFSTSILLLQVISVFLYEILPKHLIELFVSFFKQFIFLRYVIYYSSVLCIILLFGGIVYYIQKKVFSPGATAIRYLKDRKCPQCAFSIDITMHYCPKCSHQLRAQCTSCHHSKFKDLPVCEHCGHF
jgi:hypothetical protein